MRGSPFPEAQPLTAAPPARQPLPAEAGRGCFSKRRSLKLARDELFNSRKGLAATTALQIEVEPAGRGVSAQ
jgi:hypothetical protein